MKSLKHYGSLLFLGILLALPVGVYAVQHGFIRNEKEMGMSGEEDIPDDFAKKQFLYADPESAREALLYAIKIHEGMRASDPLWGRPERVDLGVCYVELSLLDEESGNNDRANADMAEAEVVFKEMGAPDSSVARLRASLGKGLVVQRPADRQRP